MGTWLVKHWWINEVGETVLAIMLGWFAWAFWEAGKIASLEISQADSYKLMGFGAFAGIMILAAFLCLYDVVVTAIKRSSLRRHKKRTAK